MHAFHEVGRRPPTTDGAGASGSKRTAPSTPWDERSITPCAMTVCAGRCAPSACFPPLRAPIRAQKQEAKDRGQEQAQAARGLGAARIGAPRRRRLISPPRLASKEERASGSSPGILNAPRLRPAGTDCSRNNEHRAPNPARPSDGMVCAAPFPLCFFPPQIGRLSQAIKG